MADIIIMPKLGFNMSEGKLIRWYKNEGDTLSKGEPVFAIETDKTSIDIEATSDGVFRKKLINEGDTVPVTLPIAIVGSADEDIDDMVKDALAHLGGKGIDELAEKSNGETGGKTASEAAVRATAAEPVTSGEKIKITPRAKKIAAENNLAPEGLAIAGTGFDGGICEKDIIAYLEKNKVKATPTAQKMAQREGLELAGIQGSGTRGRIVKSDVRGAMKSRAAASQGGKELLQTVPYSGVRKIIGERLAESMSKAPHIFFTQKVNLEKLLALRKEVNETQEVKTSVTDFIAKAVVIALQKYPNVNASLVGDKIEIYAGVNLGIAVAADSGLIVPVIRDADLKSIIEIAEDSSAMFEKARNGKLTPDEYSNGTFTISNLGMFGIENFTAIINPPEAAILAVSATKDEALVVTSETGQKSIEIKPVMNITLSADHRIIDGLLAAQFVTEVKKLLESPLKLLL